MPYEDSAGLEYAREFGDRSGVVGRIVEKAERREEIYHSVKPTCPAGRELSHVCPAIVKRRTGPARCREREKHGRIIDSVHAVARFSEQMRMATLPARRIEHPRSHRKSKCFDDATRLGSGTLRREDWIVFLEVLRIEIVFPPLRLTTQKNTGSRYAPNTVSIAARIS